MCDLNNDNIKHCRIIFDDCSQKSYVSKELADKLKLEPIGNIRMVVKGACAQVSVINSDIVQFMVKTKDDHEICVTACVVNTVCQPLSHQPLQTSIKSYFHLKGLRFSDYHGDNDDLRIDILIGGNHYYDFITDTTKRGKKGEPTAVWTKVGTYQRK